MKPIKNVEEWLKTPANAEMPLLDAYLISDMSADESPEALLGRVNEALKDEMAQGEPQL